MSNVSLLYGEQAKEYTRHDIQNNGGQSFITFHSLNSHLSVEIVFDEEGRLVQVQFTQD
nr:hypothetical protein [Brevibacillus laterosporus]